jgi:hypothetical protein
MTIEAQRNPWRTAFIVAGVLLVGYWLLGSGERSQSEARQQSVASVPTDAMPQSARYESTPITPHFVWHKGSAYGYEPELSADDRARGTVTAPLTQVRLLGRDRAGIQLLFQPGGKAIMHLSCEEPCEFVHLARYDGYGSAAVVRAAPGTIMAIAIEDARNGFLDPQPQKHRAASASNPVPPQFVPTPISYDPITTH